MKRLVIAIVVLLCSFGFLNAQNNHIISLGLDGYHNTLYDYQRNFGISLGYEFEKNINESIRLKAGLIANVAREKNIKVNPSYYRVNDSTTYLAINPRFIDESNGFSLSIQLPINFKIELIHPKLFLTGGIMFLMDNVFLNNKIYSLDGVNSNNILENLNKGPFRRLFGFGHQIGLFYEFSDRFGFYGEFKTSTNKEFTFNYFECGVKFKINKRVKS